MNMSQAPRHEQRRVGRYLMYGQIGAGGMATVRLGKLVNEIGAGQLVAIKCLHPTLGLDPRLTEMLVDEARLALRIRHPNVVSTLDVVTDQGQLFIVMEYVHGPSLSKLLSEVRHACKSVPAPVATAIMAGVLEGLHAAHETRRVSGEPLGIVHRDVSPQNILVGVDGIARVFDFGVAKAEGRSQATSAGEIKGKIAYMALEQFSGDAVDRRADVFSASVVAWEMLTGVRMAMGDYVGEIVGRIMRNAIPSVRSLNPEVSPQLNDVVMRGLSGAASDRYETARQMAIALESAVAPATPREVGAWVESLCELYLDDRAERVSEAEMDLPAVSRSTLPPKARRSSSNVKVPSSAVTKPRPAADDALSRLLGPDEQTVLAVPTKTTTRRARRYLPLLIVILCAVAIGAMRRSRWSVSPASAPSASTAAPSPSAALLGSRASPDSPGLRAASSVASAGDPLAAPLASAEVVDVPPSVKPSPIATATPKANGGARLPRASSKPANAAQPATRADCNPPFTIDQRGVRVPKPQCL